MADATRGETRVRLSLRTRGKSRFFLLHQNAMNTHKAAKALSDLMADFTDVDAKADEITALARLGTEIAQQTSVALHETPPDRRLVFAGPSISRRDALRLTHRFRSMSDSVARAATAASASQAPAPTDLAARLAASVAQCARHLESATGALTAGGDGRSRALASAETAAACAAEARSEAPAARDADDARWTDVYVALERALDSGASAAGALRAVVRKG